jgi:hypothetical protein
MITLVSNPKQHLPKDMQHSVCNNTKHTGIIYRRKFLILVGGRSQTENYQKKVHKFSCISAVCRWEVMKPEIQYPRKHIAGMFIPNSLVSKSYIMNFHTK